MGYIVRKANVMKRCPKVKQNMRINMVLMIFDNIVWFKRNLITYTPLDFIWVLYDSLWPPWSSLHLMASGHFSKGPFTLKEPPMPKIEENVRRLRGMWRLSTKNYSHGHAFSITRCWQDQERIQQLQPTMFWRIAQKLLNGRPLYKRRLVIRAP